MSSKFQTVSEKLQAAELAYSFAIEGSMAKHYTPETVKRLKSKVDRLRREAKKAG